MRIETVASILNPSTANWMSSGGGGFDTLIQGDLAGVMIACEAGQLTWAYLFSYYNIGMSYDKYVKTTTEVKTRQGTIEKTTYQRQHVSCSFNSFKHLLKDWIYSNYLNYRINKGDDMLKAIKKASTASDEINHGLALYLSTDPKRETRLAPFFKPMHHEKFKRNYKDFSILASRKLFQKLVNLSKQIDEFTKNEQKY